MAGKRISIGGGTPLTRFWRELRDEIGTKSSPPKSVLVLARRTGALNTARRKAILRQCEQILKDKRIGTELNSLLCVDVVKTLVAAMPISLPVVERLPARKSHQSAFEVHFSILLFLPQIPRKVGQKTLRRVLCLVEAYLMEADRETANAAWMAGDALGEEWPIRVTFPILKRVAREARHPVGRKSAVDGLHEYLNWRPNETYGRRVRELLRDIAEADTNSRVRRSAAVWLEHDTLFGDRKSRR